MVYKGDFEPSYLLCPETYTWVLLNDALRKKIELIKKGEARLAE